MKTINDRGVSSTILVFHLRSMTVMQTRRGSEILTLCGSLGFSAVSSFSDINCLRMWNVLNPFRHHIRAAAVYRCTRNLHLSSWETSLRKSIHNPWIYKPPWFEANFIHDAASATTTCDAGVSSWEIVSLALQMSSALPKLPEANPRASSYQT